MRIPTIPVVSPALCAGALLLLVPIPVAAQEISAHPTYGTMDLTAGFRPDPQVLPIAAGGMQRSELAGCTAYIHAAAPDVDVNYQAGSLPLTFSASSETDVVLLINTPDGRWHCDDDGGNGTDPSLTFESPLSGNYNVWVGTYAAQSGGLPDARLYVSELGNQADAAGGLNLGAAPSYGTVDLVSGFTPDPLTRSVSAGGADAAPSLDADCRGYVTAAAPDLDLNFVAGSLPLHIYVRAATDVTLLVNQPDGSWICSDDAYGTNPHVAIPNPQTGEYNIWIGTYSASAASLPTAVLYISELSPDW